MHFTLACYYQTAFICTYGRGHPAQWAVRWEGEVLFYRSDFMIHDFPSFERSSLHLLPFPLNKDPKVEWNEFYPSFCEGDHPIRPCPKLNIPWESLCEHNHQRMKRPPLHLIESSSRVQIYMLCTYSFCVAIANLCFTCTHSDSRWICIHGQNLSEKFMNHWRHEDDKYTFT